MILLMLFITMYAANYFVVRTHAAETQMAADSLSDGTAVQASKKTQDYDAITDTADDLKELISAETGVNIMEVTIDEDQYKDNIVDTTIKTGKYYTLTNNEYTLSSESATKFTKKKSTSTGTSGSVYIPSDGLPIPVMGQGWAPWASVTYWSGTISDSGCGLTACAMIVQYFTEETTTPEDILNTTGVTYTSSALAEIVSAKYGIKSMYYGSSNYDTLKDALENDHPVIVSVYGRSYDGGFLHATTKHWIVLRGLNDDGTVLINDPACGSDHGDCSNGVTLSDLCNRMGTYCFIFETKEEYDERH